MYQREGAKLESSIFWNKPPEHDRIRSTDPLGFDALREAMSDALVPLLTGATNDADDYLWTLVGLRWANESTKSLIDATIFNHGFNIFERALKQYWLRFEKKKSPGIQVVENLCRGSRPDVSRPILVDQRATGLLGSYIVSLRGLGLVQNGSLRVNEEKTNRLLVDIDFSPPRSWISSWGALNNAFSSINFKTTRHRLGMMLFDGSQPEMRLAAAAFRQRPAAKAWNQLPRMHLTKEQSRLANATTSVVRFEVVALEAFREILHGRTLPVSTNRRLCYLATAAREADPFPSSWAIGNPLRSALSDALSRLAGSGDSADALLRLHKSVIRDVRHKEPWIRCLGDKHAGYQKWRPGRGIPDFRFTNLCKLVHKTRWKPYGF